MTHGFVRKAALVLGLGCGSLALSGCDGVSVGVGVGGYYDPFYDSMLWNDYHHDVDVDIDVNHPDRPRPPGAKPKPPIAKPPAARPRPPVSRPPAARPPIHRPAPRRR